MAGSDARHIHYAILSDFSSESCIIRFAWNLKASIGTAGRNDTGIDANDVKGRVFKSSHLVFHSFLYCGRITAGSPAAIVFV